MENIKLSPPWITFVEELKLLFKKDKDVTVFYSDKSDIVTITVNKYEKYQALKQILPEEKNFGGTILGIRVEYRDLMKACTPQKLYEEAFKDNPVFKYGYTFYGTTNPITYVVFEKEVVQYWNDDMSDPHGITSTLYENIAENVFTNENGVIFSTDSEQDNGWMKHYFHNCATPEEIAEWEKYNGKGSYSNGSSPVKTAEKATKVKDLETFKSIFKNRMPPSKKQEDCFPSADDYPF